MMTDEELKRAMKAFKKRLKLTRLDDESRLGRSPLTGGGTGIESIIPPREFKQEIWDELVKRGQLSRDSDGFYRVGAFKGGVS
ncbi:MAG TPA: hypothetical protein VHM90_04510 [Phycisphaerae bacterium]|jgi:hypothetical protein|nr:hypothetical protein [Phycisphaerae bacterium]